MSNGQRNAPRMPRATPLVLLIALAILATMSYRALTSGPLSDLGEKPSRNKPQLDEVCHAQQPTIVIFSAEWCGYCKQLKEKTLTDPEVKRRLEKYVVEIVDVDARTDLARKAHISGVPATFAISGSCKTVDMLDGYASPEAFIAWLDRVEKQL